MPGEMADGGGRSLTERDNGVLMMEQAEIAQYNASYYQSSSVK
jgi:hypothetical protein